MKIIAAVIALTSSFALSALGSKAPHDSEFSCRIKAKEIAAENYRTCITEKKTLKIDKLRREYNEEMKALKYKFEKKITKLGGKFQKPHQQNKTQKESDSSINSELEQDDSRSSSSDDSAMDIPEPIPVDKDL